MKGYVTARYDVVESFESMDGPVQGTFARRTDAVEALEHLEAQGILGYIFDKLLGRVTR